MRTYSLEHMLSSMATRQPCAVRLVVPFVTAKQAEVVYNSLRVDKEPPKSNVERKLQLDGNKLIVSWEGKQSKFVRVSVSTFFDLLILTTRTMDRFGTDA